MSTPTKNRGIVVAVDGSAASDAAVAWAAAESALRDDAPIALVHVITPVMMSWPVEPLLMEIPQWYEDNAVTVLDHARKQLEASLGEQHSSAAIETEVLRNNAVAALSDCSRSAQLIVVGCRGMGAVGRLLLGSISTGLVQHAHCPVAVIHQDGEHKAASGARAPILLGVDGSQSAEAATAFAFDEASRRGVDLVALHAWSDVGVFPAVHDWHDVEARAHERLAERLAGWQERYPDVHIDRRIVCDKPARWLIEGSANAQLVVVGSHGRGGFAGMRLGSVASALAQQSATPVVVVRQQ